MTDLLPCPFCGSKPWRSGFTVQCEKCGATVTANVDDIKKPTFKDGQPRADRLWQTRAIASVQPKQDAAGTMKANENGLLPCPFCGGKAEHQESDGATGAQRYVECCDADCIGFARPYTKHATKKDAAKAWNTRALIGTPQAPHDAGRVWQPIETAPRDGTQILSGRYSREDETVFIYGLTAWVEAGHYGRQEAGWSYWTSNLGRGDPTHWMPLPAAPQPGAGQDGAG